MDGVRNWSKRLRLIFNLVFVILLFFFFFNQTKPISPLNLRRIISTSSYRWSFHTSRSNFRLQGYQKKNTKSSQVERILSENSSEIRHMVAVSPMEQGYQKENTDFSQVERIISENSSEIRHFVAATPMEQGQHHKLAESPNLVVPASEDEEDDNFCSGVKRHLNYGSECEYIKAKDHCSSGGFIEYIEFFYCTCGKVPVLGYIVLGLWLVALFYMLGNTATDFFCCSLEMLASLLKLAPTVAGATLLPLGNGAPDVFASVAAFLGADSGQIGMNSVLGGAVFVTCVVVGSICLFVDDTGVSIDHFCFVRDISFFLFTLASLYVILTVGKINLWGAVGFVSIYFVYVFSIAVKEVLRKRSKKSDFESMTPLYPVLESIYVEDNSFRQPLLDPESDTSLAGDSEFFPVPTSAPQWMCTKNVSVYADQALVKSGEAPWPLWGWNEGIKTSKSCCRFFLFLLEMPLLLPRRLTIPIVDENRWSRGFAIASAILAPTLLAFLWNFQEINSIRIGRYVYFIGVILGASLGTLAFYITKVEHPPRKFLFPWVAGGFLMSIVWFYVIANELVALLVAFGTILGISPSLLGLTVLAWGNSMGDLMSNIALALNGSSGVQIALSGCYAGPMFNTLAGLGLSLVLGAWKNQPFYIIPEDPSLIYTLGFLTAALLWVLVVLPSNNMHPSKLLGIGLLTLYLLFLLFRLGEYFGFLSMGDGMY
ncbi:hypothetical protein SUGI_0318720 [Cryptomeria japonica]|nr:hypothetical protein SUGI_0318720 [Cryptomeria japonica]